MMLQYYFDASKFGDHMNVCIPRICKLHKVHQQAGYQYCPEGFRVLHQFNTSLTSVQPVPEHTEVFPYISEASHLSFNKSSTSDGVEVMKVFREHSHRSKGATGL